MNVDMQPLKQTQETCFANQVWRIFNHNKSVILVCFKIFRILQGQVTLAVFSHFFCLS